MSAIYADEIFAPVDSDLHVVRVAGGNETEVYATDDQRFVIKVKSDEKPVPQDALVEAQAMRTAAEAFTAAVGPEHSIPNYFIVARNSQGEIQPVVIQPYLRRAQPLAGLNYNQLESAERQGIARQLRHLIGRALSFYNQTGRMPDLYGRTSRSKAERKRLNTLSRLPWRLWSFLAKRTLLRSHNLVITPAPSRRIVLVDYDPIPYGKVYQFVYYNVRRALFWRDYGLIWLMERTGYVPQE